MLTAQVDKGLQNYYKHKDVPYIDEDGEGLYTSWNCVQCNRYDIDGIEDELQKIQSNVH